MSLPPHILRIKRKRVDEPVDSLYIETKQSGSKRRHTEHNYVFRRLLPSPNFQVPASSFAASNGLPQILATQPGDEIRYERASLKDIPQAVPGTKLPLPQSNKAPSSPRRFYLSHADVHGPALPAALKKRRKSAPDVDVATFVETANQTGPDALHTTAMAVDEPAPRPEQPAAKPISPRKRPGAASSAPRVATPRRDYKDMPTDETYANMRRYAEELDAGSGDARLAVGSRSVNDDGTMDTTSDDYVYDTYERHQAMGPDAQPGGFRQHSTTSGHGAANTGPIGYLVITEEDQPLWETYYDSDANSSDERDWDSEQDDENAENYYGADYPEDEVDSADEMGENAYRYRKGSDEEEFGSGDEAWSDDEAAAKPWVKAGVSTRRLAAREGGEESAEDDD